MKKNKPKKSLSKPKSVVKIKAKIKAKAKVKTPRRLKVKTVVSKVKVLRKRSLVESKKAKGAVKKLKSANKVQSKSTSKKQKVLEILEIPVAPEPTHDSVLKHEVIEHLELGKKKHVVDATLGLGGHTQLFLENLPKDARVFAFELDAGHLAIAQKNLQKYKDQVVFIHANFSTLQEQLKQARVKGIDAILFDLGLASPHVDIAERGFSFLREGPLDMRFDLKQPTTAAHIINQYSEKELMRIFREYGEEKKARRIAQEIVKSRKNKHFTTTTQLADFIEKIIKRDSHIHPATRVFQALRIEVNRELEVLREALIQAVGLLKPQGRVAVISYHSLEDRIVKMFFKDACREYVNLPNQARSTMLEPTLRIITKKPLVPTDAEVKRNPRSRSAKLRVAEKI